MSNTSRRRRGGRRGNNTAATNNDDYYNNNDENNNYATSSSINHVVAHKRSQQRHLCEYLILNFFVGIFFRSSAAGNVLGTKFNPELVRFSAPKDEIIDYLASALPKCSSRISESRDYLLSLLDEVIASGDLQRVSYVAEQGSSLKGFSSPLVAAARCLKENVLSDSSNNRINNKPFFNPDSFIEANEKNYHQNNNATSEVNTGNFYMWNPWRRSAYFTAASLGQQQQQFDNGENNKMMTPLRFIPEDFKSDRQLYLLNGDLVQKFFAFVRSRVSSPGRLAGIDPRSCVDPEKPNQRVCDNVTNFSRLYFFADALRVVGYNRVIQEDHFFNSMTILGWHNANVAATLLRDLNEYKCGIRFMFNGAKINLRKIASSARSAIGVLIGSFAAHQGGENVRHQPDLERMEALDKIGKLNNNNNNNNNTNSLSSTSINSNQHDLFRQQQARNTADVATSIINNDFNSDYRASPSHSSPRAPSSTIAATIVGGGAAAPSSSSPVSSSVAPLRGAARGYFDDMKANLFPVSTMEVPKSFLMNMLLHKEGWTLEQQSQNLAELVEKKLIHFKIDSGNNSDDGTKVFLGEQQQQQNPHHHDAHRRDREDENSSNNQKNEVASYSTTTSGNTNNICIRFPPPALIRDGKLVTRGNPGKLLSVPPPFVRSSSSSSRKNN